MGWLKWKGLRGTTPPHHAENGSCGDEPGFPHPSPTPLPNPSPPQGERGKPADPPPAEGERGRPANPSPAEGERGSRKAPRWTIAFLRALERTGEVRTAAADAGVDHSTAYARRRTHADFAEEWDAALGAHRARAVEEESLSLDALGTNGFQVAPSPGSPPASPPSPSEGRGAGAEGRGACGARREDLLATTALGGAQLKRVGEGRWSQAKEKAFFDELAATANVKRAAEAAGVSANAVYARRIKQPLFRAKWAAVLDSGRAAIEMKLVEAANKSFDPEAMDLGEVQPKVSVAEAIRIVQLHGSKAERESIAELEPPEDEVEAIRERLFNKLERLRKREMPRWIAQGWSLDERHDCMVPPGWIRAPDHDPEPPEPGV